MKTRFAGLLCGAGFFVAVGGAAAVAETDRLPLQFRTGKTYTFQVNQSRQGPSIQGSSETPTQTDTGTDTGASERAGSPSETRSQGASRQVAARDKSIQYRIQVQNQTGDETTLEVTATPDAISSGTGTAPSSRGSSSQGSSTEGSSPQGSTSSRSGTGSGSSAGARDFQGGTWIVRVDGNGRVKNVSKRDASGTTTASSSSTSGAREGGTTEGSTGTEGSSRTEGSTSARAGENVLRQMGAEGLLRSHLAFICGANLHEEELQPGKTYSPFAGESSHQGSTGSRSQESESPSSRSGQDPTGSGATTPGGSRSSSDASSSVWLSGLQIEMLRFRFDGSSNQGGRDVAKFSILASQGRGLQGSSGSSRQGGTTGQSSQAGQGERGEAPRSQPAETQAGGTGAGSPVGQASFRKDDGILEQLTAQIGGNSPSSSQGSSSERSGSGTQGLRSSPAGQEEGFLLSIRRIESGAGTGSDTGTRTRQRE